MSSFINLNSLKTLNLKCSYRRRAPLTPLVIQNYEPLIGVDMLPRYVEDFAHKLSLTTAVVSLIVVTRHARYRTPRKTNRKGGDFTSKFSSEIGKNLKRDLKHMLAYFIFLQPYIHHSGDWLLFIFLLSFLKLFILFIFQFSASFFIQLFKLSIILCIETLRLAERRLACFSHQCQILRK